MQSEFENHVIGVLPKISGGSRGGLGGLQVPLWNPFQINRPPTVKSTVHPTPIHNPPFKSGNPVGAELDPPLKMCDQTCMMPLFFFIMSRLFNTLGVKLDPSPPAGPPPPSNKMKTWKFGILNESECAPPHDHHHLHI